MWQCLKEILGCSEKEVKVLPLKITRHALPSLSLSLLVVPFAHAVVIIGSSSITPRASCTMSSGVRAVNFGVTAVGSAKMRYARRPQAISSVAYSMSKVW